MRSTLVIARRELAERQFVFLAAASLAALSIIIPFVPLIHLGSRSDGRVILSTIFAGTFGAIFSAMLGSTIVGRELSEGRLSFYFSKPVPAPSVWLGKVIAAAVLIVISMTIIASPALVAGRRAIGRIWTVPSVAAVISLPLMVFLIAHVAGTFIRSRSWRVVIDLALAALTGIVLRFLFQELVAGFAFGLLASFIGILEAFGAAVIIAAGAWQLSRGRIDRTRSHVELSRFLWTAIGSGLLIAGAYVAWVVTASPADLDPGRLIAQQLGGGWAVIGGNARHRGDYRASFLYNVENGRAVRIPGMQAIRFSPRAKVAFWTVASSGVDQVWMARLDVPDPRPVETKIALNTPAFFTFSDDGSRLAVIGRDSMVTVYDVASGTSLGSARIPAGNYWTGFFVGPDRVRIYAWTEILFGMQIFEYDVAHHSIVATGASSRQLFRFSPDHTRGLFGIGTIVDARTGAVVRSISAPHGRFLRDGRIASTGLENGRPVLNVFSEDGLPLRTVSLPEGKWQYVIDVGGGRVVAVLPAAVPSLAVVDIDRGVVTRVERGLRPVEFNSAGPRLLCASSTAIVVWDPVTGAVQKLPG